MSDLSHTLDLKPTGMATMDATHDEFWALLQQLKQTPVAEQLALYQTVIAHTQAHFEQEDRWMLLSGFAAGNCHTKQHMGVLETMRAVVPHFEDGDHDIIVRMTDALLEWFPQHSNDMDTGLAQHLASLGFDARTETFTQAPHAEPIEGCGGVQCG